jgi:hypothetical protein
MFPSKVYVTLPRHIQMEGINHHPRRSQADTVMN